MTKDIRKNLLLKYFREFQVNMSYATNISEQKPVLSEKNSEFLVDLVITTNHIRKNLLLT